MTTDLTELERLADAATENGPNENLRPQVRAYSETLSAATVLRETFFPRAALEGSTDDLE